MDLEKLRETAREQFQKHGIPDWSFGFATSKRRLGVCKHRQKRIEIAAYYAQNNTEEKVLDTLLHEIAHALAGPVAKHGPAWKAIAERIGATPEACDRATDTVVEPGDWRATCSACQHTYHRYKTPKALTGYRCRCEARAPLTFAFHGDPASAPVVPQTAKEAAGWRAVCAGCGVVHHRVRRPKAGVWRCRCPRASELKWEWSQGQT